MSGSVNPSKADFMPFLRNCRLSRRVRATSSCFSIFIRPVASNFAASANCATQPVVERRFQPCGQTICTRQVHANHDHVAAGAAREGVASVNLEPVEVFVSRLSIPFEDFPGGMSKPSSLFF